MMVSTRFCPCVVSQERNDSDCFCTPLRSMLKKYDVHSVKVNVGGNSLQGYRREHLHDAWQRYLPLSPKEAEPMEPVEPRADKVLEVPEVPDAMGSVSGSVQCLDCTHLDPEAKLCFARNRPVDPKVDRQCPHFAVPF